MHIRLSLLRFSPNDLLNTVTQLPWFAETKRKPRKPPITSILLPTTALHANQRTQKAGGLTVLAGQYDQMLTEIPTQEEYSASSTNQTKKASLNLDVSENSGNPQIIHFNRVFHYKPSILEYPYSFGNTHFDPVESHVFYTKLQWDHQRENTAHHQGFHRLTPQGIKNVECEDAWWNP